MRRPEIAVLIPVYRDQAGLDRTLASVGAASGEFEVVMVDDGSPCPITTPVSLRSGVLIHRLRLDQNGGITRALNYGLEFVFSQGFRYVARLDAGDFVAPWRFELQSEYLDKHADCAAVSSYIEFVDHDNRPVFCHRAPTDWTEIRREMRIRNCLLHSGATIRARAILESGVYDERYRGAEDYELFLRLSRKHRLAVLPQVLTFTQCERTGLSVRGRRRQQLSRLRCQFEHFDSSMWSSPFGIARTLCAMVTPHSLVISWKRMRAHS